MTPWYDGYWPQWAVQNILPTILCAAVALAFRRRIRAWWHQDAAAARRIVAELFEHQTGERHPEDPR